MLEKRSTKAFLEAVKSSVWNRPIEESFFEGLSRAEWVEIFYMSFHQTVEGHVAESIQKLQQRLLPDSDLYLKWMVRLQRIEDRHRVMGMAVAKISKLFQENGIRAYLQKGLGVSQYYEHPEIRVSGDIDWFFPTKSDFRQASILMNKHGEEFKVQTTFSSGYKFDGIEVEHHIKLIQLRNPFVMAYAKRIIKQFSSQNMQLEIAGSLVEIPSAILNILQVNAHILKHQITYGIGLRQIIDSLRLYYILGSEIDGGELKKIYSRLGMLNWVHSFHGVLVEMLDFPADCLPFPKPEKQDVEWMKEYIIKTGNFGFYDPDHPDIQKPGGRVDREIRLFNNFRKYFPLAPVETLSFPFVQVYCKVFR